jgi:ABC-type proline/glycine betaine transport system ATPase subunit
VTHDLLEALRIGTRIAVLDAGKVECLVPRDEFMQVDKPVTRSFIDTIRV